jgi:hypothetical protein
METGPKRFATTVYDRLMREGFAMERLFEEEAEPIEFVSRRGETDLKMEFITSFQTSDDTLNRFLGKSLACNRIEAFEILLAQPVRLKVLHGRHALHLQVPDPAAFLFHKGISFVMRSEAFKLEKDLFYLYFILKYHPERTLLLKALHAYTRHELFPAFQHNVREYLASVDRPGYAILRKYLGQSVDPRSVNKEIQTDLTALFQVLDLKSP